MNTQYPWYDSWWLDCYVRARDLIREFRPELLPEFVHALDALRTRPDFDVTALEGIFDEAVMCDLEALLRDLRLADLELHELKGFGRFIIHDHPFLTELQHRVVDVVSDAAGEALEPCYNFLSRYTDLGICPVHMDAPPAKWTLDLCIRQSQPWPIHLSQIVPWPEDVSYDDNGDWERAIKDDPANRFAAHALEPGQAIFFSGSSQWHYRDAHPGGGHESEYCDLAFFHFIPKSTGELVEPRNWARLFDVPQLIDVRKAR